MKRRSFLKIGAAGSAVAAVGISPVRTRANASITETNFELVIDECTLDLIDGSSVYTVQFLRGGAASPELRVLEGEQITITVTNADDYRTHSFVIHGVPGSYIGSIGPGETGTTTFTAPTGGSYMYLDGSMGPLNRLMGLHGAFIVEPAYHGRTPGGAETPYSQADHNPQLEQLFEAFGRHERFEGEGWVSGDLSRDYLWVFSQIDPSLNARFAARETIDPSSIRDNFTPRYFTINNLSGFDTAIHSTDAGEEHDGRAARIMPSARQGQPCLLRCMNAGLANHAVHIHGNHCFELSESDYKGNRHISNNIYELDTWLLRPMQRIDMLLPYERPPDAAVWPPTEEPFPMRYVMHCHFEISQTAAGGNYPQGAVTHWEMTAPL